MFSSIIEKISYVGKSISFPDFAYIQISAKSSFVIISIDRDMQHTICTNMRSSFKFGFKLFPVLTALVSGVGRGAVWPCAAFY